MHTKIAALIGIVARDNEATASKAPEMKSLVQFRRDPPADDSSDLIMHSIIEDGMILTVDGTNGIVRIED